MNKYFWRISQLPAFLITFFNNRSTLKKIKKDGFVGSEKLHNSLNNTLNNDISEFDRAQIDVIEEIRNQWSKSNQTIPVWNAPNKIVQVSRLAKISSKPKFWSTLIFNLIREFKPNNCLELGTCIGISALYQASALKLNNNGKLITLEGDPERAKIAEENFGTANLQNIDLRIGDFDKNLPGVLNENIPHDFLFIDGNHNYESTLNYFNLILPHLSNKAIVIIDDNFHSPDMNRAWNELIEDDNVISSINLFVLGILIINKTEQRKTKYSIATLNF